MTLALLLVEYSNGDVVISLPSGNDFDEILKNVENGSFKSVSLRSLSDSNCITIYK